MCPLSRGFFKTPFRGSMSAVICLHQPTPTYFVALINDHKHHGCNLCTLSTAQGITHDHRKPSLAYTQRRSAAHQSKLGRGFNLSVCYSISLSPPLSYPSPDPTSLWSNSAAKEDTFLLQRCSACHQVSRSAVQNPHSACNFFFPHLYG